MSRRYTNPRLPLPLPSCIATVTPIPPLQTKPS